MIELGIILILTIAMGYDFCTDKIPNELIYIGISGWLLVLIQERDITAFYSQAVQMLIAFLITYPLFKIGALGAGDIKLLMTCACYLKGVSIVSCIVGSFIIGAVLGVIRLWAEDIWEERFHYFVGYVAEVIHQKRWILYEEEMLQNIQLAKGIGQMPKHRIHFSLPIFLGVILKIANVY